MLEPLTAAEATVFRRGTGIALYLGPGRFDLQFATKELAQGMQMPSKLSMMRPRRVVRYLLGTADVGPFFACQSEPNTVLVWTDGDWSGNAVTCKSTSAGAIQRGSHTIETWSVNQQVVSLSSAEGEFYAIGSGCARGLTVKHVLLEILHATTPDEDIKMTVCTDSDAARGMIHRVGCGRVRHLQTRYLWHQHAMREGHFIVARCSTKENPSDLGTKILEKEAMTSCMSKVAIVPTSALRSAIAAALTLVSSASKVIIAPTKMYYLVQDEESSMGKTKKIELPPVLAIGIVAGGAAVAITLLWYAAMSRYGVCCQQTRDDVETEKVPERIDEDACGRLIDVRPTCKAA